MILSLQVLQGGKSLDDTGFRDPESNATVLHHACETKAFNVIKQLIETQSDEFLLAEVEITIGSVPSKKTVLHQLIELGKEDLVQTLLDHISGEFYYMNKLMAN